MKAIETYIQVESDAKQLQQKDRSIPKHLQTAVRKGIDYCRKLTSRKQRLLTE